MLTQNPDTVWVVVQVESGVPVLAEVYRDEATAMNREESLRESARPDTDEVATFEVEVGVQQEA